jgi:MoaA/NifB/PqqE/SkfB family radical SAM enzyme
VKTLVVLTTDLCNMDCAHCLFARRREAPASVPVDLLCSVLDQALPLGLETVGFTGGEAGLHPEFGELVQQTVARGLRFSIVSNGYEPGLYEALLERHRDSVHHLTFSLDSHRAAVHDALRRPGSFDRVTEAVRRCASDGFDVRVSICLGTHNRRGVRRYVRFAESLGVSTVNFLSVIPNGPNAALALSDRQRMKCYRKVRRLRRGAGCKLRVRSSLMTRPEAVFCNALDLECMALTPAGEFVFCCDLTAGGGVLGSLHEERLDALIERGKELAEFLQEVRAGHLRTKTAYEGIDSCRFCYTWADRQPPRSGGRRAQVCSL